MNPGRRALDPPQVPPAADYPSLVPIEAHVRAETDLRSEVGKGTAAVVTDLEQVRRERDLREREERLARLFDIALDGIVELEGRHRLTRLNAAAEKILGCPTPEALGLPLQEFLTPESGRRLVQLIHELDRGGLRSLWIPDGLEVVRRGGEVFSAEATISRFELGGRPYYTLIM